MGENDLGPVISTSKNKSTRINTYCFLFLVLAVMLTFVLQQVKMKYRSGIKHKHKDIFTTHG